MIWKERVTNAFRQEGLTPRNRGENRYDLLNGSPMPFGRRGSRPSFTITCSTAGSQTPSGTGDVFLGLMRGGRSTERQVFSVKGQVVRRGVFGVPPSRPDGIFMRKIRPSTPPLVPNRPSSQPFAFFSRSLRRSGKPRCGPRTVQFH